jgi:hypothetical protein
MRGSSSLEGRGEHAQHKSASNSNKDSLDVLIRKSGDIMFGLMDVMSCERESGKLQWMYENAGVSGIRMQTDCKLQLHGMELARSELGGCSSIV